MAEERRRDKRLALDVSVQLERLDNEGITTLKFANVKVQDISKSGMGFICNEKLEVGSFYDVRLQIWTKEIITAVVEIVRSSGEEPGPYNYGSTFIGMSETDSLKIEIYEIFNDLR